MKKVLALLVVLGIIISGGAGVAVSASGPDDYLELPDISFPLPR